MKLTLSHVPGQWAVCRLAPGTDCQLVQDAIFNITWTPEETSLVCRYNAAPKAVPVQGPFAMLKVQGPLDFSLTGIMAALTQPLAAAGISIFAISTYDTDYLLVGENKLTEAVSTLQASGFEVV
ncbi:ACT domain-containing protein [Permianibacter sp. IMCC34836]|uniref:ACT domain-containing protein n=1 Tax=Permianibacter fluminis TaxID=2738515 RepID=UPI0015532675|nr:ACT domain-containing protein [Permianibacter fluminis]NQD36933.1 ACT domain-containing protein [Permianibacter fluminis]